MADDSNEIRISITLDDGSVREGFARIKKDGEESSKSLGDAFATAKHELLALVAAYVSFEAVKEFIVRATDAARNMESAVHGVNVALGSVGAYSKETSEQFLKLAEHIQETTTVSEESVLGLARLAIQYTKTNEAAIKLTKASVDFAAATGDDLNSALQKLEGTLSGHAGRLARIYPELKNFSEAQLKAGAAVDFFASRFSGTAASQVNTFDGRLKQMHNTLEDFYKAVGKIVTDSPALIAAFSAISDVIKAGTSKFRDQFGGKDIFKDLIINFSIIAQAGIESARQIGIQFERTYLSAKHMLDILAVIATLGLSTRNNEILQGTIDKLDALNKLSSEESPITTWFDNLILKVTQAAAVSKEKFSDIGRSLDEPKLSILSFNDIVKKVFGREAHGEIIKFANSMDEDLKKTGVRAVQALASGVSAGMSAIGRALVNGGNLFKAFAGAMLSALGQALITEGAVRMLQGIARIAASYGGDPTGWELLGVGSAMSVAGGAMMALGEGTSGAASGAPSVGGYGGGGGTGGTGGDVTGNPADQIAQHKTNVEVHIHGDVFDSRETGLRVVELINDAFTTQGAQVLVK